MKNNIVVTLMLILVVCINTQAQPIQLGEFSAFDKIVITGPLKHLEVQRGRTESPQILLEGLSEKNVKASISAGVLTVAFDNVGSDTKLIVRNSDLRRVEGVSDLVIYGGEVLNGGSGSFYITGILRNKGKNKCKTKDKLLVKGDTSFDVDVEVDTDIDIDLDTNFADMRWSYGYKYGNKEVIIQSVNGVVEKVVRENVDVDKKEKKKNNRRR
ncbi:MAG: hypothetical protein AAFX87_21945 [Bacteroidota bacterium]